MGIIRKETIKRLEQAINVLNGDDTEHLRSNILFEETTIEQISVLYDPEIENTTKKLSKSELNVELLQKFVTIVRRATLQFNSKKNIIRLIDDANNLYVFQGQIRQPYKDARDIYCKISVNNKEIPCTDEALAKIVEVVRGNVTVFQ